MTSIAPRRLTSRPKTPYVANTHGYSTQQIIERVQATILSTPNLRHMGSIMHTGEVRIDTDGAYATAATDGWNVVYNDEFVQRTATTNVGTLDIKPMVFVACHEILHKGLRHVTTCDDLFRKNPLLANGAADYVVNGILMDLIAKYPDVAKVMAGLFNDDGSYGMLYDPQYLGMDVRQVFDLLSKENEEEEENKTGPEGDFPQPSDDSDEDGGQGGDADSDSDEGDEGDDASGTGDADGEGTGQDTAPPKPRTKLEKKIADNMLDEHDRDGAKQRSDKEQSEVDRRIQQATRMGGMIAGRTGGNAIHAFDSKEAEIDWREIMDEFVREYCRGDDEMTTARFDRRLLHLGIYNPTSYSTQIGRVGVFIDTSGSTTGPLLDAFMGNLSAILTEVNPSGALLAYWDDGIRSVEEYTEGDYERVKESTKPIGGGGTEPSCIAPFITTGGDGSFDTDFDCVVILTDGEFYSGQGDWSQVSVPVLWCVIGRAAQDFKPDYGVKVAVR